MLDRRLLIGLVVDDTDWAMAAIVCGTVQLGNI
jgi:hypothetical protein